MSQSRLLAIAAFALACQGVAGPAPDGLPADPIDDRPAPADPVAPEPVPTTPDWAAGADYSDKWLVILSSKAELGHEPESLAVIAAHPELGAEVVRLSSSQFKALMPCYEIVVAKAFTDRKESIAFSEELTALGIDNYPKNAGAYVGEQQRVEAYCRGVRDEAAATCDDLRFLAWTDAPWMKLDLDPVVAERAMADAGADAPLSEDLSVWRRPMTAQKVGTVAIGDAWDVFDWSTPEKKATCTVAELAALTIGTPHFGYYEYADTHDAPGCGEPEIHARLECTGDAAGASFARPSGTAGGVYALRGEMNDALMREKGYTAMTSSAAWADLKARADAMAAEQGAELQVSHTVTRYSRDDRDVYVVHGKLITGDGNDWCGGMDVNLALVGAIESEATIVAPFREVYEVDVLGVLDHDDDQRPEIVERSFPSQTTIYESGSVACSAEVDYCDCPC